MNEVRPFAGLGGQAADIVLPPDRPAAGIDLHELRRVFRAEPAKLVTVDQVAMAGGEAEERTISLAAVRHVVPRGQQQRGDQRLAPRRAWSRMSVMMQTSPLSRRAARPAVTFRSRHWVHVAFASGPIK